MRRILYYDLLSVCKKKRDITKSQHQRLNINVKNYNT